MSALISKIKRLNLSIESLRECKNAFGLTDRQQLKLANKENKLIILIKTL